MNTLFDKIWDKHVVQKIDDGPTQLYIDRLYCHEVTTPQAFDGMRARGLSQHTDARSGQTHCRPSVEGAGGCLGAKCRRVRTYALRYAVEGQRYHPCGGAGERAFIAWHDDCLRRLAYLDARCDGGCGFRHRHLGGGDGDGLAVHPPAKAQVDAYQYQRYAWQGCDGEGCGPLFDGADYDFRRYGLFCRVCW